MNYLSDEIRRSSGGGSYAGRHDNAREAESGSIGRISAEADMKCSSPAALRLRVAQAPEMSQRKNQKI